MIASAIPPAAQWIIWALVLVVAVRLDGLFCGLETGIYVMNKGRLELHAAAGVPAARFLKRMLASPDRMLATLLIGTNVVRYLSTFAISAMFVLAGYEHGAEWLTLAVAAPLLFVTSDSVPKLVFQRLEAESVYRNVWLLKGAYRLFRSIGLLPMLLASSRALMTLAGPGGRDRAPLGHEAVAAVVAEGQASGILTPFQSAMADRVMRIAEVTVADTMIQMPKVACVSAAASRSEMLDIIRANNYSRLPVLDSTGRVVGVLNVYDVLADAEVTCPEQCMSAAFTLPMDLTVTEALYRLRAAHEAMAIVRQQDRDVGIVTIKDLVEEIVGELAAW